MCARGENRRVENVCELVLLLFSFIILWPEEGSFCLYIFHECSPEHMRIIVGLMLNLAFPCFCWRAFC